MASRDSIMGTKSSSPWGSSGHRSATSTYSSKLSSQAAGALEHHAQRLLLDARERRRNAQLQTLGDQLLSSFRPPLFFLLHVTEELGQVLISSLLGILDVPLVGLASLQRVLARGC